MSFVAVDKDGSEWVFEINPTRRKDVEWYSNLWFIELPQGSIDKLIGRRMTWDDEPVEFIEEEFEVRVKMCKTCRFREISNNQKPCSQCFKKSHYEKRED